MFRPFFGYSRECEYHRVKLSSCGGPVSLFHWLPIPSVHLYHHSAVICSHLAGDHMAPYYRLPPLSTLPVDVEVSFLELVTCLTS